MPGPKRRARKKKYLVKNTKHQTPNTDIDAEELKSPPTCSLLSSARKGTFLRNSHRDMIWLLAVVARVRRKVDRSIVHSLLGAVARTVAALSQLYIRASSPNDPPGP